MAYCDHTRTVAHTVKGEPVSGLDMRAAYQVCSNCGVHLPDTWGCLDCEFIETPTVGEPEGLRFVKGQACYRHTTWRPDPTHA